MRASFGEYVLDTDTRELRHRGRPLPLSPKALRLLQALIESAPKALSKTALHDLLWPDTVVVEANLSNLVGEIRAALDDDARRPRFIRTVHRFGYAFQSGEVADTGRASLRLRLKWPGGKADLGEGEHVIGRDADVAVCLASGSVSRRHALLRLRGDEATLEDLGSKNGTRLNGQPIKDRQLLADGDEVRAGSVRIVVRLLPLTGSTETAVSRSD